MIQLPLRSSASPLDVLCLGAHCDDIEIGCGGTILSLAAQHPLRVHWIVFSSTEQRSAEAHAAADMFLEQAVESKVEVNSFRERYFPHVAEIKEYFDQLGGELTPDLIFTHYRDDRHQDHRVVSDLTYNTFRDHLILEYEIPKYDGDLARPNFYVPLTEEQTAAKIDYLMRSFPSQHARPWFTEDLFYGLMRIRGVESGAPTGRAEAFHARKILAGPPPAI